MTRSVAVLGAGWGDEGKGVLVARLARDFLAQGARPIVVRHNGGAQAGHTVEREDGFRHVFSHLGAGTLDGAATYLSRHFTANPLLLARELDDLSRGHSRRPALLADPRMPVQLPHDMVLNALAETARGAGRHGSVGVGYGEAVARAEAGFGLTLEELLREPDASGALSRVEREWLPRRLAELERTAPGVSSLWSGLPPGLREAWISSLPLLLDLTRPLRVEELGRAEALVFEGAQGLRLDMEFGDFPHVTRSLTGLPNALDILDEAGADGRLEAIYATRCYATRHGAGPFPGEMRQGEAPVPLFSDPTNRPHPFQGSLRLAPLDRAGLALAVEQDLRRSRGFGREVEAFLSVSCLDQAADSPVPFLDGASAFAREVPEALSDILPVRAEGWGPRPSDLSFPMGRAAPAPP